MRARMGKSGFLIYSRGFKESSHELPIFATVAYFLKTPKNSGDLVIVKPEKLDFRGDFMGNCKLKKSNTGRSLSRQNTFRTIELSRLAYTSSFRYSFCSVISR